VLEATQILESCFKLPASHICQPVLYCAAPALLLSAHGEAWVLFLEKAFAQLFGNYSELEAKHPYIALQCLTGNFPKTPYPLRPLVIEKPHALRQLYSGRCHSIVSWSR
jgi:hypothetical protein